ncbi:MAG: hypothetical protein U5L04_07495 [Trueperaceae bacterium]|nr:hypothetical protein [Trueperaceae bacterium]
MRHATWPSLLILPVLLFASCTGTESPLTPTVLAIGFGDRIGLIETTLLESDVPVDERVFFVERTLPDDFDELVAFDLTGRDNDRDRLAVLSRPSGNPNLSAVSFYDTSNLDTTDPRSFQEDVDRRVLLTFAALDVDPDLDIVSEQFCPAALQVSRTGRYLAVLSRSGLPGCDDLPLDTIDIIDLVNLNNPTPLLIARIDDPIITSVLYLQQRDDLLYYFREVAGGAQLRELDLDPDGLVDRDLVTVDTTDIVDAGPVTDTLVVLEPDAFTPILDFVANPLLGDRVETSSSSLRLVSDDFASERGVYVVGANTLTVHLNILDEEEDDLQLNSRAGVSNEVYESLNRFIYFVSNNRIDKFDALSYTGEELTSRDLLPLVVNDLTNPQFATWLRVDVAPETP